jgi:hypothetical protein
VFDQAIMEFSSSYADQNERDDDAACATLWRTALDRWLTR